MRFGNYIIFLEIAIDNYLNIYELEGEIKTKSKSLEPINKLGIYDYSEITPLLDKVHKHEIQSIIMLAIFFESLINEIGIKELGSKYFANYLEKLSVPAKWELVLRLKFGKSIKSSTEEYKNFRQLIKKRNSLVHFKSKEFDKSNFKTIEDLGKLSDENSSILKKNMKTLEDFFLSVKKLNSDFSLEYFKLIDNQINRLRPTYNNV